MKIIESNIVYNLIEVDGKLTKELRIMPNNDSLQLTPYGILHLACQLLSWFQGQKKV